MKKRKVLTMLLAGSVLVTGLNTEKAEAYGGEPKAYAHHRQLTYKPNMMDTQHITYSIRGLSKSDWRYKAIKEGVLAWNKSSKIEIVKQTSAYQGYKRGDNHIFIDYVNTYSGSKVAGYAKMHHITLFKNINSLSYQHVKAMALHETGHTLGLDDLKWSSSRAMSPIVHQNAYIDRYALADLNHRYSKSGQYYFNRYSGVYRYNWTEYQLKNLSKKAYLYPNNQTY